MDGQIFIRLRHRIKTGIDQLIYLEDIAQIMVSLLCKKLSKMPVYHVSKRIVTSPYLISCMSSKRSKTWPDIDIQTVGGSEAIVEIYRQTPAFSRFICVCMALIICRSGPCHYEFPRGCQYAARSYPSI